MSGIFLSYRRADTQGWAGRLNEALSGAFGGPGLFLDTESIAPGDVFADAIEQAVRRCEVMLVLIGPHWLSSRSRAGARRLDDASDYVRLEVAAGLARGLRVIPVLLGQASMPRAEELPEPLAGLALRQAFELSDTRWDHDCGRLFKAIQRSSGLRRRGRKAQLDQDEPALAVAGGMIIEGSRIRDIAGEKGPEAGRGRGPRSLEVAKGARVTSSTVRDIVGTLSTGRGREKR
jgi:hypothetical protein